MSQSQADVKDTSYKVKNTFLEFSIPAEDNDPGSQTRRRCRSDGTDLRQQPDLRHSPLVVASKSPICSPLLQPVDETMQAVPIDEVNFELLEEAAPVGSEPSVPSRRYAEGGGGGAEAAVAQATPGLGRDEPAYVVPTTPSPFLHSAFPPSVVPPFGTYGYGIPDMGLPPAFGEGDAAQAGADGSYELQDVDGQFLQGMQLLEGMYDPSFGQYMPYGWAQMPMEGMEGMEGLEGAGTVPGDMQESLLQSLGAAAEPFVPGSPPDQAEAPIAAAEARQAQEREWERADRPPKEGGRRGKGSARDEWAEEGGRRGKGSSRDEWAEEGGRRGKGSARDEWAEEGGRRGKGRTRDEREEKPDRRSSGAGGGAGGSSASAGRAEESGGRGAANGTAGGGADGGGAGDGGHGGSEPPQPGVYTTVMLRNIPNKYTREMLIKQLSVDFNGLFDFMYLPIDFKNKCNVGYGFINFRTVEACDKFIKDFHGVDVRKCLPGLNSKKVVEVTPARVQGLAENVRRLRNSPVMNQLIDHPEWMPLLFNSSGEEEPFPNPDQPIPPVKARGRNREATNRDG